VATVPKRCGRPGAAFVAIRRFVPQLENPDAKRVPPGTAVPVPPFLRRLFPARTIVWGSTPRANSKVTLTGAGAPRRLRVDADRVGRRRHAENARRSGQSGFVAVLDGRVDPRRLRVTVDGRPLDRRQAFDAAGRPIKHEPVPAWRSVASVARALPPAEPYVVVPASARSAAAQMIPPLAPAGHCAAGRRA
jgi:hypothetical protein